MRSEEHTSELQSPLIISYAVFCLKKKNTCNLSEDWVGYSTRYGDAAGDFAPLGGLTVAEVKAIGRELGLPMDLVDKTPSDGLSGKSDEDNLGFTYAVLDRYIRTGVCDDAAGDRIGQDLAAGIAEIGRAHV